MRRLPSANGLHRPRSCSRHPYNSQDEVPNEPGGGAAAPDQRVLGRGGLLHDGLFTPRYRWVLRNFIIIMVFGLKNLLACRYYFITFSPTSSSLDLIFFFVIQYANSSEISFHFSSYKSCEILRSMCENFIWIPSSKKTFTFNGWNIVSTYLLSTYIDSFNFV